MPIYKNWQDFDTMRDKRKILVIYGAGEWGRKLLNMGNIIPDYFCDKNANLIESIDNIKRGGVITPIKCLTLKRLLIELNGRDADVLVSNAKEADIKDLHKNFNRTKFTENTVIYFHFLYDIISKKSTYKTLMFEINGKLLANERFSSENVLSLYGQTENMKKIFDMLKNAYFDSESLSLEKLEQRYKYNISIIIINKRIFVKYNDSYHFTDSKKVSSEKQIIYLFGDSRFMSFKTKKECRLDFMLQQLLNKHGDYEVQNYSISGRSKLKIIGQITIAPLVRNSIVIIGTSSNILDAYSFALIKQHCQKYNCRLIFYVIPIMLSRKILSNYERFYIEKCTLLEGYTVPLSVLSDGTLSKEEKDVLKAMDIDFYEPPDSFFNSEKVIYIDFSHFGDYGNEIIAKHLHDIIVNKVKPNNFSDIFFIDPKERIKNTFSIISQAVPDIWSYLNSLKKHKRGNQNNGSIVMNCNPFTLGHLHLIEYAANNAEHLYIFVVEEDKSEFHFADRYKLVKKNTTHLKNVTVLPSGKFIISSLTFDSYFGKSGVSEERAAEQDVSFDLLIFASAIAPALNITKRFVGQEPFDPVTRHYNEEMKQILPEHGCEVIEIPRLEENGSAVSASRVRKLLKEGDFEEIEKIVPEATFRYLRQL
jgi:[citrate (pro-3S)-lyase] ligase